MELRKALALGFYRTAPQRYLTMDLHTLFSKTREEWPQRHAEIVRVASRISKGRVVTWISTGQKATWGCEVGPSPGRVVETGPAPQWVWKTEHCDNEGYSQALKCHGVPFARFGTCSRLITLFYFQLSPFGTGMPIPCLPCHCVLEAHNLFGFADSQLERNFASG